MKHLLLSLAAFIFSLNALASYQPKVEIIEQFDNLRTIAFIEPSAIKQSPQWDPKLSPPPLTISAALEAVKNFRKEADFSNDIKEIELRQLPHENNKWHYLIKIDNPELTSKYDIYVVLLNGIVIPAIIEPQSYK